jgi:hypothetical protein
MPVGWRDTRHSTLSAGGVKWFYMDPITGVTTALAGLKTATDIATSLRKSFASHEVKNDESLRN